VDCCSRRWFSVLPFFYFLPFHHSAPLPFPAESVCPGSKALKFLPCCAQQSRTGACTPTVSAEQLPPSLTGELTQNSLGKGVRLWQAASPSRSAHVGVKVCETSPYFCRIRDIREPMAAVHMNRPLKYSTVWKHTPKEKVRADCASLRPMCSAIQCMKRYKKVFCEHGSFAGCS